MTNDANGIEWNGGECPVEPNTLIEVRDDCGRVLFQWMAWASVWDHEPGRPNVIAYRVVKP